MIFGVYGSSLLSYSYKPFGESSKTHDAIDDTLLTWASSIGAGLVNGGSRVLFGALIDKFSFRVLMTIILVTELVCCLVFYWSANSPVIFFCVTLVNYGVLGAYFTVLPVSVTRTFGLDLGPQVFV